MSNYKNMTAEEVKLEVIKLIKQKDDLINNYCLSVSPYKIGDKIIDRYGRPIIITDIEPNHWFFEKDNEYDKYPFHYSVCELKKDGTPKVHGIRMMWPEEIYSNMKTNEQKNDDNQI
jgi:hypothetical protein